MAFEAILFSFQKVFRDVILGADDFPQKLTAYTPCLRREAGSYSKDVRGLNRLHQFDKVEIVRVEKPENSYAALLEDNQKDGYIEIPQCLRPYTGFDRID